MLPALFSFERVSSFSLFVYNKIIYDDTNQPTVRGCLIQRENLNKVPNLICNADSYLKDTLFFSLRLLFAISLSFFIGSSCKEKIAYVLNKLKILSIIILRLHINCSTFQHCTNYQKSSITHSYFTYRLYVHLS